MAPLLKNESKLSELERNQSLLSGIKDMFTSISFKGGVAVGIGQN